MSRVRHTQNRDGSITLAVHDGHLTEKYNLPATEARRLAWAILADLDPDEALLAQSEAAPAAPAHRPCQCGAGPKLAHKPGSKTRVILEALARGPSDCPPLGKLIDRSNKIAASFLS